MPYFVGCVYRFYIIFLYLLVTRRDKYIYIYTPCRPIIFLLTEKKSDEKGSAHLQTNMDKIIWRQFNLRTYINIIYVRGERRVCPKWANINRPAFTTQMPPTSWARTACLFLNRFFFFYSSNVGLARISLWKNSWLSVYKYERKF